MISNVKLCRCWLVWQQWDKWVSEAAVSSHRFSLPFVNWCLKTIENTDECLFLCWHAAYVAVMKVTVSLYPLGWNHHSKFLIVAASSLISSGVQTEMDFAQLRKHHVVFSLSHLSVLYGSLQQGGHKFCSVNTLYHPVLASINVLTEVLI